MICNIPAGFELGECHEHTGPTLSQWRIMRLHFSLCFQTCSAKGICSISWCSIEGCTIGINDGHLYWNYSLLKNAPKHSKDDASRNKWRVFDLCHCTFICIALPFHLGETFSTNSGRTKNPYSAVRFFSGISFQQIYHSSCELSTGQYTFGCKLQRVKDPMRFGSSAVLHWSLTDQEFHSAVSSWTFAGNKEIVWDSKLRRTPRKTIFEKGPSSLSSARGTHKA